MLKFKKVNAKEPVRLVIAGEGGVGKSTQAALFPQPIVLPTESGLSRIKTRTGEAVDVLEDVDTWDKIMKRLTEVRDEDHDFKTLVVDSVSALEKIAHQKILHNSTKSMKTIDGGYGAGSARQEQLFVDFRDMLEQIRLKRNMHIVLIAHTTVKSAKDPSIEEDYDEFEIDMDRKSAALLRQWCDALIYVRQNTMMKSSENAKKGRVISDDSLIAYTRIDPVFRAKNRYGMPKIIPFGFDFTDRFFEYVDQGVQNEKNKVETDSDIEDSSAEAKRIRDEISLRAEDIKDESIRGKIHSYAASLKDDIAGLNGALDRVNKLIQEGK